jgi:hypothetical protein
LAATWRELKDIILSEIKSGIERQIPHFLTDMWKLKSCSQRTGDQNSGHQSLGQVWGTE